MLNFPQEPSWNSKSPNKWTHRRFFKNLDNFWVFLISFSSYFGYFYLFLALPSASENFRHPTSPYKKYYYHDNKDICKYPPQYSRWYKVHILQYVMCKKTPDGVMINIFYYISSCAKFFPRAIMKFQISKKMNKPSFFQEFR